MDSSVLKPPLAEEGAEGEPKHLFFFNFEPPSQHPDLSAQFRGNPRGTQRKFPPKPPPVGAGGASASVPAAEVSTATAMPQKQAGSLPVETKHAELSESHAAQEEAGLARLLVGTRDGDWEKGGQRNASLAQRLEAPRPDSAS